MCIRDRSRTEVAGFTWAEPTTRWTDGSWWRRHGGTNHMNSVFAALSWRRLVIIHSSIPVHIMLPLWHGNQLGQVLAFNGLSTSQLKVTSTVIVGRVCDAYFRLAVVYRCNSLVVKLECARCYAVCLRHSSLLTAVPIYILHHMLADWVRYRCFYEWSCLTGWPKTPR